MSCKTHSLLFHFGLDFFQGVIDFIYEGHAFWKETQPGSVDVGSCPSPHLLIVNHVTKPHPSLSMCTVIAQGAS